MLLSICTLTRQSAHAKTRELRSPPNWGCRTKRPVGYDSHDPERMKFELHRIIGWLAWLMVAGSGHAVDTTMAATPAPLDIGALMQPYDPAVSAFADEGYSCWDPQIIKGEDDRYYLVYSRWAKKGGDWLTTSEICLAVANHVEGPYHHLKVLLKGQGSGHWDELMACNSKLKHFGDKYYLYYISSRHGPARGNIRDSQRSGVAISSALTGPYVPLDQPIVEPAAPVYNLTVNPTVEQMPDGRFLMMLKGDLKPKKPVEPMGQRVEGMAIADHPAGPFQIQPELAIKDIDTEDADLWWDAAREKYFALFHAANFIGLIESTNGLNWQRAEHYRVCGNELLRTDGSWLKTAAPLQRPALYRENGEPRVLCLAVAEPGHWQVVMVPLKTEQRSRAANRPLLAAVPPAETPKAVKPIRVVCLGDSITAGARLEEPAKDSYPARLQALLGSGYSVTNYGVSGCTLIHKGQPNVWSTLKRLQTDKQEPDAVVIDLGINDTCGGTRHCWDYKADFPGDYRELIEALRALPFKPRLWLCAPTPMVLETPGVDGSRRADLTERIPRLDELIGVIRQVSKEQGTGFIDLHTPFVGKPELFTPRDGVHPNKAGYEAIAEMVAQALQKTSP